MAKQVRFTEESAPSLVRGADGFNYWADDRGMVRAIGGGDTTNPVTHPLGPPVVDGNSISVDMMLQQPTRITAFLMDITLQRFIMDRLFTSAGGVTGGAVVYDQAIENELYLDRDVEQVAPGGEFPIVTSPRRAPRVAEVEKFGGKFFVTREARDRNDQSVFQNENTRLGNTIVRKLNTIAVKTVEDAIAGNAGASTFTGNDWSAAIPNGSSPTPPAGTPGADFSRAQLIADQRELGISYNIALVSPVQLNELRLFYGGDLNQMLEDNGYDEIYASNRIPAGVVYHVAEGMLGEMRLEQPLLTETWEEQKTQRNWVQSSVRPVMYVTNPFAIIKSTGH
ncbi:MAG: major capsid protein [Dermatophilaceae bacterium]